MACLVITNESVLRFCLCLFLLFAMPAQSSWVSWGANDLSLNERQWLKAGLSRKALDELRAANGGNMFFPSAPKPDPSPEFVKTVLPYLRVGAQNLFWSLYDALQRPPYTEGLPKVSALLQNYAHQFVATEWAPFIHMAFSVRADEDFIPYLMAMKVCPDPKPGKLALAAFARDNIAMKDVWVGVLEADTKGLSMALKNRNSWPKIKARMERVRDLRVDDKPIDWTYRFLEVFKHPLSGFDPQLIQQIMRAWSAGRLWEADEFFRQQRDLYKISPSPWGEGCRARLFMTLIDRCFPERVEGKYDLWRALCRLEDPGKLLQMANLSSPTRDVMRASISFPVGNDAADNQWLCTQEKIQALADYAQLVELGVGVDSELFCDLFEFPSHRSKEINLAEELCARYGSSWLREAYERVLILQQGSHSYRSVARAFLLRAIARQGFTKWDQSFVEFERMRRGLSRFKGFENSYFKARIFVALCLEQDSPKLSPRTIAMAWRVHFYFAMTAPEGPLEFMERVIEFLSSDNVAAIRKSLRKRPQ